MGKIITYIAVSLDGYIARENGSIDWLPQSDSSEYDEFYKNIDAVVMGKTTYEQILTFGRDPYEDKKSYVFTRNKNFQGGEKVEFVSDVKDFVRNILPNLKGNVWPVGGGHIISSFVNHKVVDEITLSIIPVVLGKGIPLF